MLALPTFSTAQPVSPQALSFNTRHTPVLFTRRLHSLQRLLVCSFLSCALFTSAARAVNEIVEVRYVIDGDSVVLSNGKHVRLIGINAPERGRDGTPSQPIAAKARARLAALAESRRVKLVFEQEREDRHGRWLAHLELPDGVRVAQVLLREGLVWTMAVSPNLERLSENLEAEKAARTARRGVWGVSAYAATPANRLNNKSTGFRFIEGTVQRRTQKHHVIYFELTPQVSLLVSKGDWKNYFSGHPSDLVGRKIIARGWLTESRGQLHMRVSHPAMLTSGG